MPAKATSFSLMMNSWQTCSLWAMLSCLLFSCEQGCDRHKNPVLCCSSHFMGKLGAFTESAGTEMEAWMEPSRKVLEGSHELNYNIVIPVSVLLQNIFSGFRDSDNWTDNVWSQSPWTSLMLQLVSSVYCSILGKTSQRRKIKLTWGSSSLFTKDEYIFISSPAKALHSLPTGANGRRKWGSSPGSSKALSGGSICLSENVSAFHRILSFLSVGYIRQILMTTPD